MILGPVEVRDGSELVELRGAQLQTLLVRLAVDAGKLVSVGALSEALWGDDSPQSSLNALQSLVSRLRRSLPSASIVQSRPGGYVLAVDRADVDALEFADLVRQGRQKLQSGDPAAASVLLHEALDLWRGDPMPELRESSFGEEMAAGLEKAHRSAVEDRLDADVALHRGPDVLAELQALADADPYSERVAGLLMQALFDAGRQAEALERYEHMRGQLAERLGVDPSPALQEIHLRLLRGEASHAVEPAVHRSNLPSSVSSFLGRDDDLKQVAALLSAHRLVTIIGPGGCGKTRLAEEAAAHELGRGPVWLVELAPVTNPDDISQAVLDAIDLRSLSALDSRRQPSDALMLLEETLADDPALLVLDNCEHLVDGAARVSEHLLSRCPQLRILATSREPLAITGEVLHPLRTLALPVEGATNAEAMQCDAVRLFVDRARAVHPAFVLDDDATPAVVEVCRRLDGLPLAIELAAARMRTMTLQQLEARLDDRFRLLTGGSRTAVARHRTLRAVVEWSWDLLSAEERLLAERFSVFPAGATAEAATAVCLPGSERDEVEDALAALADKSLMQVVAPRGARDVRYRMLETLRDFGNEKLAARAELLPTRRAHTQYYLELAEHCEPLLRTVDQLDALAVLGVERDNVLAALRFAADDGDADTAVRLAAALGWYWLMEDSHAEAATWLRVALDVPGESEPQSRALV
ncbi:MAG TPA: BTAD domain-containing putative transcriptional regulator, partial [Actinomycetes bacterium]|nr:BTAD domain-containing putative transcriptional regulator [Actinomycetes bacterium]